MSKRLRTESLVITACDLADAIEEVQYLVPEFSIEKVLDKTRQINRMLREIPLDVLYLYSLLKDREWMMEAHPTQQDYNILLEISCEPSQKLLMALPFFAMGFKILSWSSSNNMLDEATVELATDRPCFDVTCTHPNALSVASQLMMLRDQLKNPMIMLGRDYSIPLTVIFSSAE